MNNFEVCTHDWTTQVLKIHQFVTVVVIIIRIFYKPDCQSISS